jgi:TonB family protein
MRGGLATSEEEMMNGFLHRMIGAAAAVVVIAIAARAQGTVCDSPCVMMRLPLITPRDMPVPNSNPLAELQSRMWMPYQGLAYREHEVDKPVVQVKNGVEPQYPDAFLEKRASGVVSASFIVGTDGRADTASLRILTTSHPLLSDAVREALPRMRFIPAELKGVKVRQIVDRRFVFDITKATPCESPCPFMLLPLPNPNAGTVQQKLPFVIHQVPEGLMPSPAYFEYQVDKPAVQAPGSVWPVYPDSLKKAKVEGDVVASFAVDTLGRVDVETIQILKWTQQLFVVAVLDALPLMKFRPAEINGTKVRQLVQQPFVFHVKK